MRAPNLRQGVVGLCALCGALVILAAGATSALADRTFVANSAFTNVNGVAFDANDNVWVIGWFPTLHKPQPGWDNPTAGLYGLDPYPSQTLLDTPITPFGANSSLQAVAVDQSTNDVFVGTSNLDEVFVFSKAGFSRYTAIDSWDSIDGHSVGPDVAVDNSNTFSRGRVYLSIPSPQNDVEVVDAGKRPVDFPATASYITDNKLTGTPSGPFGSILNTAVDPNGDLFVFDIGQNVVDEFASTGIFLRTFPSGGIPATDPTNGNVLISEYPSTVEYDSSGNLLGTISDGSPVAVNSQGYLYTGSGPIYSPAPAVPAVTDEPVTSPTTNSGTLNANVDPNGGGNVAECKFEYGEAEGSYSLGVVPCKAPGSLPYTSATDVSTEISGLSTGTTYHYRVVASDANGTKYGKDQTYTPDHVLALSTDPASGLGEAEATLNGSFAGNGEDTHYHFEWGPTEAYGNITQLEAAGSPSGPARTPLSTDLTGLNPYTTYHFRVVATNGSGTTDGQDQMFTTTPGAPSANGAAVTAVHSDRALFHGQINPNGADTTVHFEYVDDATFQQSGFANATVTSSEIGIGMSKHFQSASTLVDRLSPGTLYHYRVVGANEAGSNSSAATFRTFPFIPSYNDPCPNAHVRQQTGSALLLDCRAYELVSAAKAGGYDVESSLVAGQEPFGGYPEAENPSRVLYGVHDGGIPGSGHPTNKGVDPYVATRGENGWSTKYVGIPANDPFATAPFSSTPEEADPSLDTLAFGGPNICSPCFEDHSTGIPVHKPNEELVQGMAGSLDPGPAAKPEGFIGRHLSPDGTHLVFGSKAKFEPDGNEGEVSIYDRNLSKGETHVVSKTPAGQTMKEEGTEIGELDLSKDGSRIVIGHLVEEVGNAKYWHLYMNIGDEGKTIDLTPGTTHGVLFDGMTADGSKVFFTTEDRLLPEDTDNSADIYEAEVGPSASVTLRLISTGTEGTGNTDSCDPAANTKHVHWNTTGSEENCGVVAIGGGGGVSSGNGTIYFLSPEKLDGGSNGVQNAPNLYVARPGQAPHFVATLESSANAPLPPPIHPFVREFGSFSNDTGVAIDHATGDSFVFEIGTHFSPGPGAVLKFDSSGHPVRSFGNEGTLIVNGTYGGFNLPTQIAVDNSCSLHQPPLTGSACEAFDPSNGYLYVPLILTAQVAVFNPSGRQEGLISAPDAPTAVAVDPANGNVYIAEFFGRVSVYEPGGAFVTSFSTIPNPAGIAVDSSGNAYVTNGPFAGPNSVTEKYDASGKDLGQLTGAPSVGVAVDPSDDHVYVDEGDRVVEFDPAGKEVGAPTSLPAGSNSIGLAADSGTLVVSSKARTNVTVFGPPVLPSDPSTDNPAVIDSVSAPGALNTANFEPNPSGNAVFTSTLPLTGYDNAAHREIFRYDPPSETLDCASCNPTGEQATGEATLASNGSSLSDDGRVFFNSTEGLVDRDLNEKQDVYEWEPEGFEFQFEHEKFQACEEAGGCTQLISTGTSPLDSSLLGASADGTDAYFFTHDTLVSSDGNGNRVKIYDARAGGGFAQTPPPHQCQASDECHGPSSSTPPPPNIKTIAGTPIGNVPQTSNKHHHHHGHHHHRRAHHKRRGVK
jgi:hypothetical protein